MLAHGVAVQQVVGQSSGASQDFDLLVVQPDAPTVSTFFNLNRAHHEGDHSPVATRTLATCRSGLFRRRQTGGHVAKPLHDGRFWRRCGRGACLGGYVSMVVFWRALAAAATEILYTKEVAVVA